MNSKTLASHHRFHLLVLALIVVLAGGLRFFSLSALGFWTDEFCSLSAAHGWGLQLDDVPDNQFLPVMRVCTHLRDAKPFVEIPAAMARDDAHPPLYFMLLRGWEKIFGDSESGVRSLNVVLSLLAIILLYFVARDSVGSSTALVACLLMAVASPQIQLSQEARNYMPVLVFALLAAMSIEKLRRAPGWFWATILGACLLAMMLTHYFAAGAAIGLVGYGLFSLGKRARRLTLAASIIAAILFALLWGRPMLQQRAVFKSGLGWLSDEGQGRLGRRFFDLCRLPVRYCMEDTDRHYQTQIAVAGFVLLLGIPILFVRRRELRMWIAWLVSVIGVVAIADVVRGTSQLYWVRYTLFATPAAYVLIAAAVQRGRWKYLLPSIAVLLAIIHLPNAYVPAWKTDFRSPVQIIGNRLGARDGLVIFGADPIFEGILYAACQHYLPVMPDVSAVLTRLPDETMITRLKTCPHVWLIEIWFSHLPVPPGFVIEDQYSIPYFADLVLMRPQGQEPSHSR